MEAIKVIDQVKDIINTYSEQSKKSCGYFNMFEITGIATDEVKMCKMLAELLNPKGSHCQGCIYLKWFFDTVLNLEIDNEELFTAHVYTEYLTYGNRRIDIVITTYKRFVPIEVKIYAADQDRQCKDYFDYMLRLNCNKQNKVYYLTIDGHLPVDNGAIGLTPQKFNNEIISYEEIKAVSFKEEVLNWLDACLNDENTKNIAVIYGAIKQFKSAIERLSGSMGRELKEDIIGLLSANCDNMRTACRICESVNDAKERLIKKLFHTLEERIKQEKPDLVQVNNRFDYKYDNYISLRNYYKYSKSTWPALTYRYKTLKDGIEIWFRIEIDYNLFAGFVVTKDDENPQKQLLTNEQLKEHLPHFDSITDGWWGYWEYLPVHNNNAAYTPNFKIHNDIFYSLFDEDYFEEFIDKCMKRILEIWK